MSSPSGVRKYGLEPKAIFSAETGIPYRYGKGARKDTEKAVRKVRDLVKKLERTQRALADLGKAVTHEQQANFGVARGVMLRDLKETARSRKPEAPQQALPNDALKFLEVYATERTNLRRHAEFERIFQAESERVCGKRRQHLVDQEVAAFAQRLERGEVSSLSLEKQKLY